MARIRTIKPEMFASLGRQGVSIEARWFMAGMATYADDHGRFEWMPRKVLGCLYPEDAQVHESDVIKWAQELVAIGVIELYEIDGRTYGHFPKWLLHQKVKNPSKSYLPEPQTSRRDSTNTEDESESYGDYTEDVPQSPVLEHRNIGNRNIGNTNPLPPSSDSSKEKPEPPEGQPSGSPDVCEEVPWYEDEFYEDQELAEVGRKIAATRLNSRSKPFPYRFVTEAHARRARKALAQCPTEHLLGLFWHSWYEFHQKRTSRWKPYIDLGATIDNWATSNLPNWEKHRRLASSVAARESGPDLPKWKREEASA